MLAHETWINEMNAVQIGAVIHSPTHQLIYMATASLIFDSSAAANIISSLAGERYFLSLELSLGFQDCLGFRNVSTSLHGIYVTSSTLQSCQATAVILVTILLSLIEMPVLAPVPQIRRR